MGEMMEYIGSSCRNPKRAPSGLYASITVALTPSAPPAFSISMAAPPNVDIQRAQTAVGASRAQIMNSRTVRPLEMRAMNMPTNGDHAIHQAQ